MSINPFRKSVIRKSKSKIFKGRIKEKEEIAKQAGISGFSNLRMKKVLKDRGYTPVKRRKIMDKVLGKKKINESLVKIEMDKDSSVIEEKRKYSRTKTDVLGKVGGGVKGTARGRFGIERKSSGFASDFNKTMNSISSQSIDIKGKKPLGF